MFGTDLRDFFGGGGGIQRGDEFFETREIADGAGEGGAEEIVYPDEDVAALDAAPQTTHAQLPLFEFHAEGAANGGGHAHNVKGIDEQCVFGHLGGGSGEFA